MRPPRWLANRDEEKAELWGRYFDLLVGERRYGEFL
jgi:hypothetical protein